MLDRRRGVDEVVERAEVDGAAIGREHRRGHERLAREARRGTRVAPVRGTVARDVDAVDRVGLPRRVVEIARRPGREVDDAVVDERRRDDLAAAFWIGRVERVEGAERPQHLPGHRIDRVEPAVAAADVEDAVGAERGRALDGAVQAVDVLAGRALAVLAAVVRVAERHRPRFDRGPERRGEVPAEAVQAAIELGPRRRVRGQRAVAADRAPAPEEEIARGVDRGGRAHVELAAELAARDVGGGRRGGRTGERALMGALGIGTPHRPIRRRWRGAREHHEHRQDPRRSGAAVHRRLPLGSGSARSHEREPPARPRQDRGRVADPRRNGRMHTRSRAGRRGAPMIRRNQVASAGPRARGGGPDGGKLVSEDLRESSRIGSSA